MVIRRAMPSDAGVAARIIAQALAEHGLAFEPGERDADVASFGARDGHDDFVALDDDGAPCGIVSVGPHGDPGVAWVSKLFVSRAMRGRGVGRALLARAEDAARARGCTSVGLRTRSIFTSAVRLYEAAGYRRDEAGPDLASGELVYWRRLVPPGGPG